MLLHQIDRDGEALIFMLNVIDQLINTIYQRHELLDH